MSELPIDPDPAAAETPPGAFYGDPGRYAAQLERVLLPSWQVVGQPLPLAVEGEAVRPFTLLPGSLDEPLLLARDEAGAQRVLSNVCTHRGALLAEAACEVRGLRCRYHGRRFGLDGRLLGAPGFEGARDFPRPDDDLPRLPLERWGPLLFTALAPPPAPFAEVFAPVQERLGWWLEGPLALDPAACRTYEVAAHWALYCDNYLEGLHVPYVHPALNAALDFGAYRTEVFPWCSLQVGVAREEEDAFELPAGHPDRGQRVAAYYFFVFPNLMLNVYPWGLSLNLVLPQGPARTQVAYAAFVRDPSRRGRGPGGPLHQTELEDEAVVESVQRGVRARLYRRGRYAPAHERAVHQFHRLLAARLEGAP